MACPRSEHSLIVEMGNGELLVVALDVEPNRLVEPHGVIDVDDGQYWRDVDAAGLHHQPTDADPTDLDLVVAQQRRHHGRVTFFTAAEALHSSIVRRPAIVCLATSRIGEASSRTASYCGCHEDNDMQRVGR